MSHLKGSKLHTPLPSSSSRTSPHTVMLSSLILGRKILWLPTRYTSFGTSITKVVVMTREFRKIFFSVCACWRTSTVLLIFPRPSQLQYVLSSRSDVCSSQRRLGLSFLIPMSKALLRTMRAPASLARHLNPLERRDSRLPLADEALMLDMSTSPTPQPGSLPIRASVPVHLKQRVAKMPRS